MLNCVLLVIADSGNRIEFFDKTQCRLYLEGDEIVRAFSASALPPRELSMRLLKKISFEKIVTYLKKLNLLDQLSKFIGNTRKFCFQVLFEKKNIPKVIRNYNKYSLK